MAKKYKNLENEIEREFKEILLNMDPEEFEEYFKQLIDKYYSYVFTFNNNPSEHIEESKKKYEIIKKVKQLLHFKYNNLNNYENSIRLDKAEDIAYNNMLELNSMENSYSNIIYYNATQELNFINTTFSKLVGLYEKEPSEELLSIIEKLLNDVAVIIRDIKKLPVHENLEEHKETIQFKKEHFKELSERDKEELPEIIEEEIYTVPILSNSLYNSIKKFNSIFEDLKKLLPEYVIADFYNGVNSSEMLEFYYFLLNSKTEEETEEEIKEIVAYTYYLKKKHDKGYLYNIIESWS